MLEHLPAFCLGMSTETCGGGRLTGTWDISISVPRETDPPVQFITMEPAGTVTQLSIRCFTVLVLEDFLLALAVGH